MNMNEHHEYDREDILETAKCRVCVKGPAELHHKVTSVALALTGFPYQFLGLHVIP